MARPLTTPAYSPWLTRLCCLIALILFLTAAYRTTGWDAMRWQDVGLAVLSLGMGAAWGLT